MAPPTNRTPLVYVFPVHNEESVLPDLFDSLARNQSGRIEGVILVENGSRDRTLELCHQFAATANGFRVQVETVPRAGMGYAYDLGLRVAIESYDPNTWFLLSAADLPFEYSDVRSFQEARLDARMFIGSKAHPESMVGGRGVRRWGSVAYRLARRLIGGMRTGDSQGTIFVRGDLARLIAPRVLARDFFYTTELVCIAEHLGERVVELPITLAEERRPSSVRLLRNGARMVRQLVELRRRAPWRDILREQGPARR